MNTIIPNTNPALCIVEPVFAGEHKVIDIAYTPIVGWRVLPSGAAVPVMPVSVVGSYWAMYDRNTGYCYSDSECHGHFDEDGLLIHFSTMVESKVA